MQQKIPMKEYTKEEEKNFNTHDRALAYATCF